MLAIDHDCVGECEVVGESENNPCEIASQLISALRDSNEQADLRFSELIDVIQNLINKQHDVLLKVLELTSRPAILHKD